MVNKTPPSPEQAALDRLPRSSAYWRQVRERLTRLLRRDPGAFWESLFDAINSPDPDTAADIRELLECNPDPTFADGDAFLRRRRHEAKR